MGGGRLRSSRRVLGSGAWRCGAAGALSPSRCQYLSFYWGCVCVCCGGSALPLWGAADLSVRMLPRWGKSRQSRILGGLSPPWSQAGAAPCIGSQPGGGCGLMVSVTWGRGATEGMSGLGLGSLRCLRRKSAAPGLWEPEDGASSTGAAAGCHGGPRAQPGWELRVPVASQWDRPPAPTGVGLCSRVTGSRFVPCNGAGTSPRPRL